MPTEQEFQEYKEKQEQLRLEIKQLDRDLKWKQQTDAKYGPIYSASFNAVISYGLAVIRGSFLLNGGGSVALLAFMGQSLKAQCIDLSDPLRLFILGAVLSALTASSSYLSQTFFSEAIAHNWNNAVTPSKHSVAKSKYWRTWGYLCQYTSVILILISFICFWEAVSQAYEILKAAPPTCP